MTVRHGCSSVFNLAKSASYTMPPRSSAVLSSGLGMDYREAPSEDRAEWSRLEERQSADPAGQDLQAGRFTVTTEGVEQHASESSDRTGRAIPRTRRG